VEAEGRASAVGLPAFTFTLEAALELHVQDSVPEPPSPGWVVGGELHQSERRGHFTTIRLAGRGLAEYLSASFRRVTGSARLAHPPDAREIATDSVNPRRRCRPPIGRSRIESVDLPVAHVRDQFGLLPRRAPLTTSMAGNQARPA